MGEWVYYTYIACGVLIIVAVIFSIVAQAKVNRAYSTYQKIKAQSGITGQELAQRIISGANLDVKVGIIRGKLTDNYNPVTKTVNLSQANAQSSSIAALGVVAHELGHALQHAKGYKPFKLRQTVVKVSNIASKLLLPLVIIGVICDFIWISGWVGTAFIWAVVAFYFCSALVNVVTLPVEYDASNRAMKMLEGMQVLHEEELSGARKVLSSAALTYVASMAVSVLYLLRFLLIAIGRDR